VLEGCVCISSGGGEPEDSVDAGEPGSGGEFMMVGLDQVDDANFVTTPSRVPTRQHGGLSDTSAFGNTSIKQHGRLVNGGVFLWNGRDPTRLLA